MRGKLVRVTGKVVERSDLPAFAQREGEPVMAGMPEGQASSPLIQTVREPPISTKALDEPSDVGAAFLL